MRVAFLVNDLQLSGGVGVVIQHARRLSRLPDWDVTLVLVREDEDVSWHGYEHLPHLHVRSRAEALAERYDVAVATWWETTFTLFELQAERYAYFVQNLEDRFYHHDQAERLGAALTFDLPVSFITEGQWIAETLGALRPGAPVHLVRNGIDKGVFSPPRELEPALDGPLRVLVEGAPTSWFKHVPAAFQAAAAMREPHHVTVVCGDHKALGQVPADEVIGPLSHRELAAVYRRSHVVLKLSSVEGVFGPPLEGFHMGATCVVTPVTGHEEYVEHGYNGLLTDWGDLEGTARQLDLLCRDRELLHFLRTNALQTARAWPDWEQASQFMAAALLTIRRDPQPAGPQASARLLEDLRGAVEIYNWHLRERLDFALRALRFERRLDRVRHLPGARQALMLSSTPIGRRLTAPVRRIIRWVLRALS